MINILIVSSEIEVTRQYQEQLKKAKQAVRVTCLSNARKAYDKIKSGTHFDFIMLDTGKKANEVVVNLKKLPVFEDVALWHRGKDLMAASEMLADGYVDGLISETADLGEIFQMIKKHHMFNYEM